jgi:hypothetical protein
MRRSLASARDDKRSARDDMGYVMPMKKILTAGKNLIECRRRSWRMIVWVGIFYLKIAL